jgi:CBS domain-containing protein
VEDDAGRLVGLVSHRELLRLISRGQTGPVDPVAIEDIMKRDVITVRPETRTLDAIRAMRASKVGCLPVIDGQGQLVGIVTESDLLQVAAALMEQQLAETI